MLSIRNIKIIKTAALYMSFYSLGLCLAIPGPTLLDLQNIVKTDTGKIAFIYLARSGAALVGSLIGGAVFDTVANKQLLLTICNGMMTISALATPWCRDVGWLVVVWAIGGLAAGASDTGSNVLCLSIWGEESAPYFQALHFVFGLGAFVAPLIAEPFLSKPIDVHTFNYSGQLNATDLEMNESFTTELLPFDDTGIPPVTYAYSIIGGFSGLVTIFFLVLAILYPDSPKNEKESTKEEKTAKDSMGYTIAITLTATLLLGLHCGIEIGFGQMLPTYAVKGDLKLSKSTASFLAAVYWGTFTFIRGFTVFLATRFTPFTLVLGDLMVVLTGSIILQVFGSTHVEALWVGTAVLAVGISSFFPTVITWVECYIDVTNKIASVFVVAGTFGEMVVPLTVGRYIESQPHMLMHIVLGCNIGAGVVTFLLWMITSKKGKKRQDSKDEKPQ